MEVMMYYIIGAIIIWMIFRKLTAPKVTNISGVELNELLKEKKGYHFIDVRTSGEFNSNKVKGFKNIPLQSIGNKLDKLPKEETIVLMCASGSRSMRAARILDKAGYKNLINVRGGISRMA